ncbi:MAG: hypothetical protein GY740_10730 [Gammaproteobacteria bacterium]|jgi:hypothetical protein|nr:hypothetical protein [Gammaproteobacteria bacterium]
MNNFSKELIETIAALYSGEAMKGDPTEIKITGHVVWLAQQAKKAADAGNSKGNKFSDRLTNCRSRLLDGEAILHHLHKPENLAHLLEECSPEVTLGAMIDKAWNLVSEASGDCEAMTEASDEDLKAELQETVQEVQGVQEEGNPLVKYFDALDEIHAQTDSLLAMFLLYLNQAHDGGETFNEHLLANYVWQLQSNMKRAQEVSEELYKKTK